MTLRESIEQLAARDLAAIDREAALQRFTEFKFFLNRGDIRAAEKTSAGWRVNLWVKQGILLGFRLGVLADVSLDAQFRYFDKSTYPLKSMTLDDGIRVVPGGSSIRDGAYVARGVVCMPPMYINVGAYVDEGTMVDSHALVGSCAQVGKRVHVSAAAQIGGVLEPAGALPVIIEDEVMLGGNTGVYEGTIVSRRAVLAAGVVLTGGTQVYDAVKQTVYRRKGAEPLVIPEGAVVVPGTRPLGSPWAREQGLSVATPIIIKYRDEKTDASTALEESLR
jgi:2,3,4,5-tetrahydropyridine-2,6-dicarboxylate N-succinyltransferase